MVILFEALARAELEIEGTVLLLTTPQIIMDVQALAQIGINVSIRHPHKQPRAPHRS